MLTKLGEITHSVRRLLCVKQTACPKLTKQIVTRNDDINQDSR